MTSLISLPSRHFISSTLFSSFGTLLGNIFGFLATLLKPKDIFLASIGLFLTKMPLENVYKQKRNSCGQGAARARNVIDSLSISSLIIFNSIAKLNKSQFLAYNIYIKQYLRE